MANENKTAQELKKDFPIFKILVRGKPLIYLDNGATSQKPVQVIAAIEKFFREQNANIHRGVYSLSQKATEVYENARKTTAEFINADENEIIFTKGATESLNALAYTLNSIITEKKKNEIVLTVMEHHANLIPWQQLAKRTGMKLKFINIKEDFTLDMDDAEKKITKKTAIVSVVHVSNAIGIINDVKKICKLAKDNNAISIVDAAQSVPHMKIDVKDMGCDFLAFSGHKMMGPTGVGVLYGKKELLERLEPFQFGGNMIRTVKLEEASWSGSPAKFEAGTPPIAEAIALAEAVRYISKIGIDNIEKWEHKLIDYALKKMKKIPEIKLYSPKKSAGIISFNIKNAHPHDIASLLDDEGICIRGGHHCTMPLMEKLKVNSTCRISFYVYNTFEDVDKFVEALKKIQEMFN